MIDLSLSVELSDGRRRFSLDLSLATQARCVALHGPSGAGKSLTLQAVAGLVRPRAGHVRVAGHTLFDAAAGVDLPTHERGVGYLFQQYALFPHLTVRQNVAFGLTSWRRGLPDADAEWVDGWIERFGLTKMTASRPSALSGGQQQRVALARALASRPRLLLLDEPFAALHPVLRKQLRAELSAARAAADVPMLLVTHDVDDVLALADEVVLLDDGRVLQQLPLAADASARLNDALKAVGWA